MKSKICMPLLLVISLWLLLPSCVKKDDYEVPSASLTGRIIQEGSDNNVQTNIGNFSVRLHQLSWDSVPVPQDIPVKSDGTYLNNKLFPGHYRISIKGGAFWPVLPDQIDISSTSKYDFKLTPYLLINNFSAVLTDSTTLKINFQLEAPLEGIPKIIEIQPYVNSTSVVGPGASIYDFSDLNHKVINKQWADLSDNEKAPEIIISNLIHGRIFYVRVGVKFDNDDKSSNLSSIIKITVP